MVFDTSNWQRLKMLIPRVGKSVERNDFFFLAIPVIALMYASFELKIPLLAIYPIEIFKYANMFLRMLIVSLFTNYKEQETTQMSINWVC